MITKLDTEMFHSEPCKRFILRSIGHKAFRISLSVIGRNQLVYTRIYHKLYW